MIELRGQPFIIWEGGHRSSFFFSEKLTNFTPPKIGARATLFLFRKDPPNPDIKCIAPINTMKLILLGIYLWADIQYTCMCQTLCNSVKPKLLWKNEPWRKNNRLFNWQRFKWLDTKCLNGIGNTKNCLNEIVWKQFKWDHGNGLKWEWSWLKWSEKSNSSIFSTNYHQW